MATYSIGDLSRREILRMSAILGVTSVVSTKFAFARAALHRTPGQILGPFYPVKPFDQNADLTKVPGRPGHAEGEILNVMGRVLNLKGEPVSNSKVEVWQANAHGRYTHPSDTNPAPLDPNFEGSAALTTDPEGRYRFKTIKPGAYPIGPNTIRPAHIHFEVYGKQDRLVTQMYFEGDLTTARIAFCKVRGERNCSSRSYCRRLQSSNQSRNWWYSTSCCTRAS
jgi:protocatechuate 3,4-dioxygenase beta subunit